MIKTNQQKTSQLETFRHGAIIKLVLGITGGIAAYKAAELVRLLVKANYDVQVVMTESSTQFITPTTMQALSGKPVFIGMWDSQIDNGMPHIDISRDADAIVIAPCTAEFVAKLLHGRADDLLSTLCLARDCPLIVAPAMNKQMWENPATARNFAQLVEDNIIVLGPGSGEQACGEIGLGRMLEPDQLLAGINSFFTPKLLAGKRVLITAGATLEMIDPVRAITNLSSGKMGMAIAQTAADMGADVTFIYGKIDFSQSEIDALGSNIHTLCSLSAESMYLAVMSQIKDFKFGSQDIFIGVAAVTDYTPSKLNAQKIKKQAASLTIELTATKDILKDVASLPCAPFCVGFAAETQHLIEYASAKRIAKKLPLIVANDAKTAIGNDENSVTLIDDTGSYVLLKADKKVIAQGVLTHISNMLK